MMDPLPRPICKLGGKNKRNSVIFWTWWFGANQTDLAKLFGISRTRVSHLIHRQATVRRLAYYEEHKNIDDRPSYRIVWTRERPPRPGRRVSFTARNW